MDKDNFIFLTGFIKRLILVGGFNVYPEEVERMCLTHPAVKSCRAFGAPDEVMGEKVVAEVSLKPGMTADPTEIRKYLRSVLAPYKTPRKLEIIG